MRYKQAIVVWAVISPAAWIGMFFILIGGRTSHVWLAVVASFLMLFSLLISIAAISQCLNGNYFFKKIDEIEKELDHTIEVRKKYTDLIEQLQTTSINKEPISWQNTEKNQ